MSTVDLRLGDCLEVMKTLPDGSVDAVVTDPPYPDALLDKWALVGLDFLGGIPQRQLVFWSATAPFPLSFTGIHIWAKDGVGVGKMYERIFERNGTRECLVFRGQIMNNDFNAHIGRDVWTKHPAQKPIELMRRLVTRACPSGATVLDPFMGSGTTGVACVQTGRNFIGIEIDPGYFAIAQKRIAEAQLQMRLPLE
jgi:DNA modification methylase